MEHGIPAPLLRPLSAYLCYALGTIAGAWLLHDICLRWWLARRLPPGPWQVPVLGHMHNFFGGTAKFVRFMQQLPSRYPGACTVFFGRKLAVILNGYSAIHEGLIKNADKLATRDTSIFGLSDYSNNAGILFSKDWKEQRKFALEVLREHGMGKLAFERTIQTEAQALCDALDSYDGKPTTPEQELQRAFANVTCSIVLGKRFDYDDTEFSGFLFGLLNGFDNTALSDIVRYVPIFRLLPGDPFRVHAVRRQKEANFAYVGKLIDEHRGDLDPECPRDFIDCYLIKMREQTSLLAHSFHEENLASDVLQLILAGTDTSKTVLKWAIMYMATYPDIQNRVKEEIKSAVGHRLPSVTDRSSTPYTEAVIAEVLRISNVASISIPYLVTETFKLGQHEIPAGTCLMANLQSVTHDEAIFKDCDTFKPERHLDANGNYKKSDKILVFSIGRRACLGESLARMELYIFFVSLLQRYTLVLETKNPTFKIRSADTGLLHAPQATPVRFIKEE